MQLLADDYQGVLNKKSTCFVNYDSDLQEITIHEAYSYVF